MPAVRTACSTSSRGTGSALNARAERRVAISAAKSAARRSISSGARRVKPRGRNGWEDPGMGGQGKEKRMGVVNVFAATG